MTNVKDSTYVPKGTHRHLVTFVININFVIYVTYVTFVLFDYFAKGNQNYKLRFN
jgi:hypothetical protein